MRMGSCCDDQGGGGAKGGGIIQRQENLEMMAQVPLSYLSPRFPTKSSKFNTPSIRKVARFLLLPPTQSFYLPRIGSLLSLYHQSIYLIQLHLPPREYHDVRVRRP